MDSRLMYHAVPRRMIEIEREATRRRELHDATDDAGERRSFRSRVLRTRPEPAPEPTPAPAPRVAA